MFAQREIGRLSEGSQQILAVNHLTEVGVVRKFSLPIGDASSALSTVFLGLGVLALGFTTSGNGTLDCVIGATGTDSLKMLRPATGYFAGR